jgi:DNA replication protein DnaC
MNDDLDQLLTSLKMQRAREVLPRELERAAREAPSYDAFLAGILREEYTYKRQKSLEYRIEHARIPELWTLETFPFDAQPGVKAPVIRQLAGLDFVTAGQNIVFIGPAGAGKTGLATGLLYKALVNGYRGRFVRAQDLFNDINASLLERSSRRILNELAGYPVLCIDLW